MQFTQIPNKLLDSEMEKMGDTELRIVLIVIRKTLGWIKNPGRKKRKKEDWIAYGQIIKLSGRKERAISKAVNICVKNKWIIAKNSKGDILNTPQKRVVGRGGRIFYSLGSIFIKKIKRCKKDSFLIKGAENTLKGAKRNPFKVHATKETSIQKKSIQKNDKYNKIFNFWNSKKTIKQRTLNEETKNAIEEKLKEKYTIAEIKKAINNYNIISNSKLHFFSHKWILKDFLRNGFEKFLSEKVAMENYKKHLSEDEELKIAIKNDTNNE